MEKNLGKTSPVTANGTVFQELLKRGYSIEGKNKVWNIVDSKLWYLTSEQAEAFLNLEKKDEKQRMFMNKEIELLNKKFPVDKNSFIAEYRLFGIVRLLQALGAYGFRGLYERKPNFTSSIPPAVRQLERLLRGTDLRDTLPELCTISEKLSERWGKSDLESRPKPEVIIESFSFYKGIPDTFSTDGGFMFDCRHILVPQNTETSESVTGRDIIAVNLLDNSKDAADLTENAFRMITGALTSEGMSEIKTIRVCFGCSTGRITSVYCAERVAEMLRQEKLADVIVFHHEIR